VEFSANTETEFNRQLKIAAMKYFANQGQRSRAEIQVQTDTGAWMSGNYPPGNYGPFVEFGKPHPEKLWNSVRKFNRAGTFFEFEIKNLLNFVRE
jgi:hypothetical protein